MGLLCSALIRPEKQNRVSFSSGSTSADHCELVALKNSSIGAKFSREKQLMILSLSVVAALVLWTGAISSQSVAASHAGQSWARKI